MKIQCLVGFIVTSVMLSGCDTSIENCSSPATKKLIDQLLTEQTVKLTAKKRDDQYDGSFVFGAIKIRSALAQIRIAVDNIKAVKQDPDGKSSCIGQLNVTAPPPMLTDVDLAREAQHQIKIAPYAGQLGIENSNNVFFQEVDYSVKPAGDGKELHVEFESAAWAHLLDAITTAVLLKPTLDIQEIDKTRLNKQPKQETGQLKPKAEQVKSEAEKMSAIPERHDLDKLNKPALKPEPVEKEQLKLPVSRQNAAQPLPPPIKQASPGFNCSKATKPTDITICAYSDLAGLDVKNMALYKQAKTIDPIATKKIRMESIKSKYACGAAVDCIATAYKKSIRDYACVAAKDKLKCNGDATPINGVGL